MQYVAVIGTQTLHMILLIDHGVNLSGSLGYKITSLTLSIPIRVVNTLSRPKPHPACGGIPQSNACK